MTDPATPAGNVPDPVDWPTARRVARVVGGRDPLSLSYLGTSLDRDFTALTEEAEGYVADFTGLRGPGRATAAVLDRGGWVDANVESMRRLLAPLTQRLGERLASSAIAPLGRIVTGTEVGVLLGYLSQRVLGQYDLLVPEGASGDAVYYVGPNVLGLEKRFAFRPRDFRLWIAIHEVTHRAQFTGVPWLKSYFLSLVDKTLNIVEPDPRTLLDAMRRAGDELRRGRNPLDDGGIVGLFASREQRGVLDQVQALMSLLEGHGNFVMSELGRRHVAGEERMARILHTRRQASGLNSVVQKLLGFEMKMRQYDVGERFIRAVTDEAGLGVLDAAWQGPEALPTLEELRVPSQWLTRVGASSPAARATGTA
ncbi:MAG: hypothetical protein JWL83_4861 [Actinomycetia bacterium]|nr:hypothetical protein [Actinomycetes bacterium]